MVAGGLVVGCITQQYIREADKGEGWGFLWEAYIVPTTKQPAARLCICSGSKCIQIPQLFGLPEGHSQHLNAALCAKEGSPATVEIHGETSDQPAVATLLIQNCCKHRLWIKSWHFQGIIPEGKLLSQNFKIVKIQPTGGELGPLLLIVKTPEGANFTAVSFQPFPRLAACRKMQNLPRGVKMRRMLAYSRKRTRGSAEPRILCAWAPLYANFPDHPPYSSAAEKIVNCIHPEYLGTDVGT